MQKYRPMPSEWETKKLYAKGKNHFHRVFCSFKFSASIRHVVVTEGADLWPWRTAFRPVQSGQNRKYIHVCIAYRISHIQVSITYN